MTQLWKYIVYSSTFLVLLFSLYYLQFYSVNYSRELKEYEGYLIDDEEFSGYIRCNHEEGLSFTDKYNVGVSSLYRKNKSYIREPIYFKVLGRITDHGKSGWGMAGEPWDRDIEIDKVVEVKKGLIENCTINYPFRVIEIQYEEEKFEKPLRPMEVKAFPKVNS